MNTNNKHASCKDLFFSRRSLYYESKQQIKDWKTKQMIEEALRIHPAYGHKRLATHLSINKKRILRVMKIFGIKPYRRTTKNPWKTKKDKGSIFPNLLLTETPLYPNHIWATDFTYLKFQGKWLYVCTVIDLYTREIIGLSILNNHSTQLVVNALLNALMFNSKPEIIHSDQGSEYTSKDFVSFCSNIKIIQSMSHPGCPWENGYQESFYKGFKVELADYNRFKNLGELVAEIYSQIYYYNNSRIHSALQTSPKEFAKLNQLATIQSI
jgi:transposase InsO family protein